MNVPHYLLRTKAGYVTNCDYADTVHLKAITFMFTLSRKQFKIGDTVRVSNSLSAVRELQKGHGGWNDEMEIVSP